MPLEKAITNSILNYLNSLPGCIAEKVQGNAVSSGRADINGCYKGQSFRIEVKTPDHRNTSSKKQELNLIKWERAGALIIVTYSLEFVKRVITPKGLRPQLRKLRMKENNGMLSWARLSAR